MHYTYATTGTCSKQIDFEINDNVITDISFMGGCNGNLKAISKLCNGMEANKIAEILLGNDCGMRGTSCADQLAKAVLEASKQN